MKNYTVKKYEQEDYLKWNAFIGQAKNATFLFHRDFMEYHKDRFEDYSLLVFEEGKLVALLPANVVGDSVYSHQGLTYGGLVFMSKIKTALIEIILDEILSFLKKDKKDKFYYNPIPSFYLPEGNSQVDFFLLKKGGVLERKEMNLAINLKEPLQISKSKLKHFRRIENLNLEIVESSDLKAFWELVLEPRLLERFNVKPVHSIAEISKLKQNFPENIKQYSVYSNNEIVGGITIFESGNTVKSQYGATSEKGEEVRALDFLFISLIEKYKQEGKYFFDMGIVVEKNIKGYNAGLLNQKEELGCTVYSQDYYKINLV